MIHTRQAPNGEPKTQRKNLRKARVHTGTSVPKEQNMNHMDGISYLMNGTKVKISVSPREMWKKHLEDSSVTENFIPDTTRVEETAHCSEKFLEMSNSGQYLLAHMRETSRISPGSDGSSSLSDNSHQLKSSCKRGQLSNSNNEEQTNSKNAIDYNVDTDIHLRKKKKPRTSGRKPQIYDDALDISEHHTQTRREGEMSNSMESSDTSFSKNKTPEHKLKKKKYAVIKQDLFDITSPTVLHQTKQLMKDTWKKTGNLNVDPEITKSCDQPKIFESRSSADSILNVRPKNALRKKVPRPHGKNPYESLMGTSNNVDPIAELENKTGNVSSGSASSIAPVPKNVRYNFKQIHLKRCMFDSVVENPVAEDSVRNMQANVDDPCTSEQQNKDISAEMDVRKAPAFAKIVGKRNKKHFQPNYSESVVGNNDGSAEHEKQNNDIALAENYAENTLAASISAEMDVLKAPASAKIIGKRNKKHLQPNYSELVVGNNDESAEQNIEKQGSYIALAENYAKNTFAGIISAEMDVLKAPASAKIIGKRNKKHLQPNYSELVVGNNDESAEQNIEKQDSYIALAENYAKNTFAGSISAEMDVMKAPASAKIVGKRNKKHLQPNYSELAVGNNDKSAEPTVEKQHSDIALDENYAQNGLAANTKESVEVSATNLFIMKVLGKKIDPVSPHTFELSGMQGDSHKNHNLEGSRQTNDGDYNNSVDILVKRKAFHGLKHTSEYDCHTLPEFGRPVESPSYSLTISKFKPKITSSKIVVDKDEIIEQCPPTLAALQQEATSNMLKVTHKEKQTYQSDNPIAHQPRVSDHESEETKCKERKKCYNSVCDNTLSSDLTFDPDNVPHSTMVKSSSKKEHPPSAMRKIETKTRRSLAASFLELAHVSTESSETVSSGTEKAGIRNNNFTLNGRESGNEPTIESKINDNGMKHSELETNEHHSNTVRKDASFANKIPVPENLDAVSDHKPITESIPSNVLNFLTSNYRTSEQSAGDNDVSQVFGHMRNKTKSLAKSRSINSQDELINADSKNEKKKQGNNKSVPGELANSPDHIVFQKIIKPQNMGCDTKQSVSLPGMGSISSYSTSKAQEKCDNHAEIDQISPFNTFAQKICNSEVEELNLRKSDKASLRAERRKSSNYSYVAVSSSKLIETDVSTSKKGSNVRSITKMTDASIENKTDYAVAPNFSEEHCTSKGTPELRELSSPSLSASHINKTSHKENFSLSIKNSSEVRKNVNKNSAANNVSNAKIVISDSPRFSKANNGKGHDEYLKDSFHRNRQTENEKQSFTDTQPQLTDDDDANGAEGETSMVIGGLRELTTPPRSASQINTSHKENFSPNTENSSKVRSKENNKNSIVSPLSNAKIIHSVSSGLSNANNDKTPNDDHFKDSINRNSQTRSERRSYADNHPQPVVDNDADGTEEERPVVNTAPLEESKCIIHQKKSDLRQTHGKPTVHARFLIDGEPYHKPKLARPKPWINQRFYNHILPKFDRKFGLNSSVKCEEFVKVLCTEVTACIRERKNWDVHVYSVQKLLRKYLSVNTYAHFLIFGEKYLPDEFIFKVGLTYEKHYRNK
ncbi:uncharacterized protein LOC124775078 [Schistocerca piceifrons]|uniref:uncharacterized protein LOC124775078 n=1 Tax=Schistocerca piceifrons TaxID=274613 RepID=UPI001F5F3BB1|nr:uncharacterized protein LOC124775078 [Schistocerca piceifrons]